MSICVHCSQKFKRPPADKMDRAFSQTFRFERRVDCGRFAGERVDRSGDESDLSSGVAYVGPLQHPLIRPERASKLVFELVMTNVSSFWYMEIQRIKKIMPILNWHFAIICRCVCT